MSSSGRHPEERIRDVFQYQLDEGVHPGAQLAVYKDGERVIELADGTATPEGRPTTADTRHVLFSCTKAYTAVCVHSLVENGQLDYDDPVQEHWPAFAGPGTEKAEITIRHVLSHQAGIPESPVDEEPDLWTDWSSIVAAMENTEISFEPGTTAGYHPLTYGWILGEIVRRITGESVAEFAEETIFGPLGMDNTSIGLAEGDADDVATVTGFEAPDRWGASDTASPPVADRRTVELYNRESVHRSVIPAAGGIGTAADMARFYAALGNGGVLDGTRILEDSTVRTAVAEAVAVEDDYTLGDERRYALGFARPSRPFHRYGVLGPESVFGHAGGKSVIGWADPDANLAAAYVTNGRREDYEEAARQNAIADAVRMCYAL